MNSKFPPGMQNVQQRNFKQMNWIEVNNLILAQRPISLEKESRWHNICHYDRTMDVNFGVSKLALLRYQEAFWYHNMAS